MSRAKTIESHVELRYVQSRRSAPFRQGGSLFKRTTYQEGSLRLEERKRGPSVWVFRWWDTDASGRRLYRKHQVGDFSQFPNEASAKAAVGVLRLTINRQSQRGSAGRIAVQSLWDHYQTEELPSKELSTQDAYTYYANKWILPRWGRVALQGIRTVEVERWLRDMTVANGTKAKLKCIMSAMYSHAVRWEFVPSNPISSGIPVGSGGKRG